MQRRQFFSCGDILCKKDTIFNVKIEDLVFLFIEKVLFQQILHATLSAENQCESLQLLACESQKIRFLFDGRNILTNL